MSKTALLSGSEGFIGSYICNELLSHGYKVIGIDNYSKYEKVVRPHNNHVNFTFFEEDITKWDIKEVCSRLEIQKIDHFIMGAAMIGGISYFSKFAYDLLAHNERILANSFDLAIKLYKEYFLEKVTVLSSSMVYENCFKYPSKEEYVNESVPPSSCYGFQKLASEYFAKGAFSQYKLPYTIIRPFNCVGIGEEECISDSQILSGNIKLMLSHVVPDIINKTLKGQNPLHILGDGSQIRCYTNGRDIARGIRLSLENKEAINNDFNISTPESISVLDLAKMIWNKINKNKQFNYISDKPFIHDVQKRIPDVSKAEKILGFKAEISLNESIDEVISYMQRHK